MTVETEMPSNVDEMMQYPFDIPVTMPIEPDSLLTVATDGSDEAQIDNIVTFCLELSE